MAIILAGRQTIRMVPNSIPCPPSRSEEIMAAMAADTGLLVMPNEAAMTERLIGRSGRVLLAWAISLMIGSRL